MRGTAGIGGEVPGTLTKSIVLVSVLPEHRDTDAGQALVGPRIALARLLYGLDIAPGRDDFLALDPFLAERTGHGGDAAENHQRMLSSTRLNAGSAGGAILKKKKHRTKHHMNDFICLQKLWSKVNWIDPVAAATRLRVASSETGPRCPLPMRSPGRLCRMIIW